MRIASYLLGFALITAGACGKSTPAADTAQATAPATTTTAAAPTTPPPAPDVASAGNATVEAADAGAAAPEVAPEEVAAAEPEPYIRVVVPHADPAKPTVIADFKRFEVVEANVDLTKLETAKAIIAIEIDSFVSGDEKRDAHVKSDELLDMAKFPKAMLTVDRIKAAAAVDGKEAPKDTYEATAKLELHGVTKELPVTFKVVATKPDGAIVIEGEAKDLARADWGVTADPTKIGVAATFAAQVRLELRNVAAPLTAEEQDQLKTLFGKMLDHQEAVLKILEENKDDVAKAAVALEAYVAKYGEELKKITADGKAMAEKGGREAMMKIVDSVKDRLQGAMTRLQAVTTGNPKLLEDERIKKAMSAFGGN